MSGEKSLGQFDEAEKLYESRRYTEALKILQILNNAHPNTKNILYALARCFNKIEDFETAKALCKQCIQQWDSPRAKTLLEKIERQTGTAKSDDASWVALKVKPTKPKSTGVLVAKLLVIFVGILSISYTAYFYPFEKIPDASAPGSQAPQTSLGQLEEVFEHQLQEEDVRSEEPGLVIPESVWKSNAPNGIPRWRPGIYERVSCKGTSVTMPTGNVIPRTIDVYIPMAYQDRPEARFPVVFMNGSRINPGFFQLEYWAEKNDVILVTVNLVGNGIYEQNHISQDEAFDVVMKTMRSYDGLFFAIGGSGGGATSWEMICRHSEHFAGLVMMAMSWSHNRCWIPAHVRVAYIYGETDHNRDGIENIIPLLQEKGNPVRYQMVPGGHVEGPLEVREEMLSWMLKDAILERVREDRNLEQ